MSPAVRKGSVPTSAGASEPPIASRRHGSLLIAHLLEATRPLEAQLAAPAIKAFPIKAIVLADPDEARGVRALQVELQRPGMHVDEMRRLLPRDRERVLSLRPTRSMPTVPGPTSRLPGATPSHHPILPEMNPSPLNGGLDWRRRIGGNGRGASCFERAHPWTRCGGESSAKGSAGRKGAFRAKKARDKPDASGKTLTKGVGRETVGCESRRRDTGLRGEPPGTTR